MIYILASLYLSVFLRQSATSPPIDWQPFVLALIAGGGVAVTVLGIIGAIIVDRVKTTNAAHLVEVNKSLESVRAEQLQDTNLSEAITNLTDSTKGFLALLNKTATTAEDRNANQFRMANLMAEQNDLFDQLTKKVQEMKADLSSGRAEIISKVTEKIGDADTKAVERHTEDAQLFNAVRADVAAVKTDLDEKTAEILRRFDEAPTVEGHQKIARQITGMLDEIKARLAAIEARLPAAEPPKADGAALAGDGVPVIPPTESKDVTQ